MEELGRASDQVTNGGGDRCHVDDSRIRDLFPDSASMAFPTIYERSKKFCKKSKKKRNSRNPVKYSNRKFASFLFLFDI